MLEAAHVLYQAAHRLLAPRVGHEIERQCQRVRRLRVRGEATGGGDVLSVERHFDPLEQRTVLTGLLRSTQDRGRASEQARRVGEEGGRDEVLIGGRSRSEEHTSELQSQSNLVCRLLLEKKNIIYQHAPRV